MGPGRRGRECTIQEAKAQLETNFWGCVRVVQQVLPAMRAQGGGRIVLMSSIGGVIGIPFQAFYSASKFALEGLGESLAYEVAPLGVQVTLVEPGNVKTDFTDSRRTAEAAVRRPGLRRRPCQGDPPDGTRRANGVPAADVAAVVRECWTRRPPRRVSVGKASERAGLLAKRLLPFRAFEAAPEEQPRRLTTAPARDLARPRAGKKIGALSGRQIQVRSVAMTTTAAAAGSWMLGDLAVNRMGFGAMRLAGAQSGVPGDRAQAIWVLRRAVGLGVNHIDTAAFYFSPSRSANELINSALAPYPDDLVITTKVWPGLDPSGEWYWAEPSQLRGQLEENLRQLGRDHLDVVNLRIPRSAEGASIAEHFAALAALRAAGLIRHLGISGISAPQLAEARAIAPVVCVQNRYGLEAPAADHSLLDLCGTQGIAFVPFFAIAGRRLRGGPAPADEAVSAIAKAHDATPAQVRLALDPAPRPARARHSRDRRPRAPDRKHRCGPLRLSSQEISSLAATPLPSYPHPSDPPN